MLKSRYNKNPQDMIEDETNAQKAWKTLERNKPRGSSIANSTFKKFESLTLASCNDNPQLYANTFKKVAREFRVLSPKLTFSDVWLVYHFHAGLGPVYNSYCEQYSQNHDPFDDDGEAKFTLDYAVTRFINTITDPSNGTISSAESQALAALVNGTFAHTQQSVNALVAASVAARKTEHKIQQGTHAGNSRTFTTTCKYCTHYKKDYHDDSEYTTLHPHLKKKDNRGGNDNGNSNGNGRGRGRGRSGRGGRGGRGGNNNNNAPKDESKDAEAAAAFSFMAYTKQPTFEATCLIANSQRLQDQTIAKKTMAQTSSVSIAAALSALWFIDSAYTQHMVRDRSVFETFSPFPSPAKVNGVTGHILAEGIGRIRLQCKGLGGKRTLVINDVWYVPSSKFNLISQGQLEDQGMKLLLVPGGIGIREYSIVFRRQRNRLYALDTWTEAPVCLAVINRDIPAYNESPMTALTTDSNINLEPQINKETLRIWYSRYGYLGYQNIKKLAKMCVGMDLTIPPPGDACEPYSIANMKVEPHKRYIELGRWENNLIYSDIQGLFPTSYDGYRQIITFLDDKTLRSAVAFLPNKEGPIVLRAFKTFLN